MQTAVASISDHRQPKPIIKWAGGKGQLIDEISALYPDELGNTIVKYAEPFVGGGAVLFDILSKYTLDAIYISDINAELINMYRIIRDCADELIDMLSTIENGYLAADDENRKSIFYQHREHYNDLIMNGRSKNSIDSAALFIFLNRTCFNGLYRVNRRGLYNVPMGSYKHPTICDADNIMAVSHSLRHVDIICGDYRKSSTFIDDSTFVYFDPPYRPLSITSSFTAYTDNEFTDKSQAELAEYIQHLCARGAYIVLSNSDPKNTDPEDDFFDCLYSKQIIKRVMAHRMINCNSNDRGEITELLICNHKKGRRYMKRDFNEWLAKFKSSISDYGYYVDFTKVVENVERYKVELSILNSLIGSKHIEDDFMRILRKYPETLQCIPLLLAVRGYEIYAQENGNEWIYRFDRMNYSVEQYADLMKKTGLFNMLEHHLLNNLIDYALGVETGLDSNGRKNRGGHLMENLVEGYIIKAGFVKDKDYFKEMYLDDVEKRWGLDLSALSNEGKTRKRFDFVVKTTSMVYAVETNFYGGTGGGSKLNETARSYKMLAQEAAAVKGFTFVWFTDGTAWRSARGNLRETFEILDTVYSINDMENGVMQNLFV